MRKKKCVLVFLSVLLVLCIPGQVMADYYDYHVDTGEYCMQAKNIRITDTQRKKWLKEGILKEKILEKSGVFVNLFHPSNSTEYWTKYDGEYEIDIQPLEDFVIKKGKQSETVPVVFYLKGTEGISLTVQVEVISSQGGDTKQEEASKNHAKSRDTGKQTGENNQFFLQEYRFPFWLLMTILALLGFGTGLYSDFKVIRKYKRKRRDRIECGD